MRGWRHVVIVVMSLVMGVPLVAQDAAGVVPDLTGLNVAQAAAALSEAGLLLGQQIPVTWTEASGRRRRPSSTRPCQPARRARQGRPSMLRSLAALMCFSSMMKTI